MSEAAVAPARTFAIELDVLRGGAALLMIANHAGYRLLPPDLPTGSVGAAIVFIGSFAPVVFFFSTGFGIGLSTARTSVVAPLWPVLWKALLLVLADQFFYWRVGASWGMDFFGFIALSSVAVTLIARLRRPAVACAALICVLIVVRYGFGSLLRAHIHTGGWGDWLIGVHGVKNISYPLSPWMVFPLLGFVLGRQYDALSETSPARRDRWLIRGAVFAAGLFMLGGLFARLNLPFFRWGVVSGAYFELALGIVLAAGLASVMVVRSLPAMSKALALRGVASFAVIPVHYALLDAYSTAFATPVALWQFALLFLLIAAIAFRASAVFADWVSSPGFMRLRAGAPLLLAGICGSALALWLGTPNAWATAALVLVAQLAVAALLGQRVGKQRVEVLATSQTPLNT